MLASFKQAFTSTVGFLQGNVEQFMKFTGWYGPKVLYFGDHVYSDLMVSLQHNTMTFLLSLHNSWMITFSFVLE